MDKKSLTTGEVAKLCDVSIPTIHKWIREEIIGSFKMPGSGKLRIPREEVYKFMEEHGFPFEKTQTKSNILIITSKDSYTTKFANSLKQDKFYDFQLVNDIFAAGIAVTKSQPGFVLIDTSIPGTDTKSVCQTIRQTINDGSILFIAVAKSFSPAEKKKLKKYGFSEYFELPFKITSLRKKIESLSN